ncbi:hypothetical protein NWP96_00145 [Mycoplasmopsis cynos]|nr:hypothetical protein [Mycoplasmopsis cynos]
MTVEQKAELLNKFIDNIEYPDKNAPAKTTLKAKVEEIKNEVNKTETEKLMNLTTFETELNKIKKALTKIIKDIEALEYPNPQLKKFNVEIHAKAKFKEKLNILIKEEDILKVLPSDWAEKVKKYNEVFIKIGTFIKTYSLKKVLHKQITQPIKVEQKNY